MADLLDRKYMKLISNDELEFILDIRVARQCERISEELRLLEFEIKTDIPSLRFNSIRGEVLEIIVQYLHYRSRYLSTETNKVPQFRINPDLALDVLNASLYLKI